MSALQKELSDFKRKIQESTQVPSWGVAAAKSNVAGPSYSQPSTPPASSTAASPSDPKKKKPKTNVVYSQPKERGTGTNLNTQLVFAVEYLKKQQNPVRLEDLAVFSGTPLLDNADLRQMFNSHPQVVINPKTGTYTYKHEYQVRSPEELLKEIKARGKEGSGISIKQLKETFPTAPQVIEEFEKKGLVLVMRTNKDAQPRLVFWNDVAEEQGGKKVEDEFLSLWAGLHNPVEADLLKSLERDGLQATASEALPSKPTPGKKKGKKTRTSTRPAKITNTHLSGIDLTKDFVKPS